MKLKKILLTSIVTVLGLAIIGGAGIFAYYQNKTLSQENTITIGTQVKTIALGTASVAGTTDGLYPGDEVTLDYTVEVKDTEAPTVSWELTAVDGTNFDESKFTIEVEKYTGEYGTNQETITEGVTTVANGDKIRVTITMNADAGYSNELVPDFTGVKLVVTLSDTIG